ncbi:MAG TPA: transposase, partial [Polyangiaceae bacterium]
PEHWARHPVHVTLRSAFRPLRSQHVFPTLRIALARANRRAPDRFRIVHFSVQYDHVHLLVEARDKRSLSAGVRSVSIRIARYVNELLGRKGRLWADRWFGRELVSPREVRTALVYVLANFRKHARRRPPSGIDPFSSGAWFDGFRGYRPESGQVPWAGRAPPPFAPDEDAAKHSAWLVRPPRTRLGGVVWRRCGLIELHEAPRSASLPRRATATASAS